MFAKIYIGTDVKKKINAGIRLRSYAYAYLRKYTLKVTRKLTLDRKACYILVYRISNIV